MSNGVVISKRPNLTAGQKELYSVILQKLKDNTKLTFDETKRIYLGFVNRNMIDGVPHSYQYDYQAKQYKLLPMPQEYLGVTIVMWLTQNIGSLVLKGYLKVLPILELQ